MDQTPFSQQIAHLAKGTLDAELTEELTELVKQINENHKGGTITLTLKLKPTIVGQDVAYIQIDADIAVKHPKPQRLASHLFPTYDGDLLRQDPDQRELDLKSIDTAPPIPRNIDQETGEIL